MTTRVYYRLKLYISIPNINNNDHFLGMIMILLYNILSYKLKIC